VCAGGGAAHTHPNFPQFIEMIRTENYSSFWCGMAPGPVLGARSAPEDGGSSEFRTEYYSNSIMTFMYSPFDRSMVW
jgi:hypothetical protein